jgi:hypothetical protein
VTENGSGGIRTLSISRSKREWSAGCLPSHNAVPGAGIEPAASTFRAWRHYQQQLPRSRRFGKEDSNLHRLIQSQGACQLADSRERPAGVEPAYRTWEARAWPLGPGRYARCSFSDATFHHGESERDRGFEPRSPGWKPGVVPLDQSRSAFDSRAEGEGVEPSRLIARPSSSRVPSPIGLPFRK